MTTITSRHHPIVKEFRRVARGDDRVALIDGWHLFEDALDAALRVEHIAVARDTLNAHNTRLLENAHREGAAIVEVAPAVMDALSPVRTPSGIVALVERRHTSLAQLLHPVPAMIVVAVDMQDPGNVGAVIRSAEAGGATGVVVAGRSSDPWGWKSLRAAMGSTFRMPVLTTHEPDPVLESLRAGGVKVWASVPRGGTPMQETDMRGPVALMMGGEGRGLGDALLHMADGRVTIPMHPRVESLNAAVAAALLVYEGRRQRQVDR